jgi:hypothetical protein
MNVGYGLGGLVLPKGMYTTMGFTRCMGFFYRNDEEKKGNG